MKIEKISETQIKFFLTKEDLEERNLKISELAYASDKAQSLFKDVLDQALKEYGFEASNIPLMIEAIPVSNESIMIVVSKVTEDNNPEDAFALAPPTMEERKFKEKPLIDDFSSDTSETFTISGNENITIYSFKDLDNAIKASLRLSGIYTGTNILCKFEEKYFLILENDNSDDDLTIETLDSVLYEYGQKHTSNVITKYYLYEHGEIIIKEGAIKVLASI